MHATKRRFEPAVIERLFAQPYRFQYFQAVRMIELWVEMAHETGREIPQPKGRRLLYA